jgi:hypothetical protein
MENGKSVGSFATLLGAAVMWRENPQGTEIYEVGLVDLILCTATQAEQISGGEELLLNKGLKSLVERAPGDTQMITFYNTGSAGKHGSSALRPGASTRP